MNLSDLDKQTFYVVAHKNTEELLFDKRLFNNVTAAKNAFTQHFKHYKWTRDKRYNKYQGKNFSEQSDYIVVEICYKLEEK
ncbi:hypothetical protein VPHG_00050 [Vibrio phage 11895-B1]|uniref:hypothetical protein n=1 Tax=Vibrio phage 11895-B1 TaxID=754075 RepID=UPI0002C128EA|nr:hypothetical protein VPHG_00050 [Vibrio phage 11895-B1]AGH32117.1 hypothetical protein VPHG_00050 [Vibrio phage 11895-B1]